MSREQESAANAAARAALSVMIPDLPSGTAHRPSPGVPEISLQAFKVLTLVCGRERSRHDLLQNELRGWEASAFTHLALRLVRKGLLSKRLRNPYAYFVATDKGRQAVREVVDFVASASKGHSGAILPNGQMQDAPGRTREASDDVQVAPPTGE